MRLLKTLRYLTPFEGKRTFSPILMFMGGRGAEVGSGAVPHRLRIKQKNSIILAAENPPFIRVLGEKGPIKLNFE
jgi:hypothetical protein